MKERERLEISYKRRLGQSYMIAEQDGGPEEPHELTVLAYNRIPGLLAMETEVADGSIRFWYDISGRQTVSDYLERRLVDRRLLLLLFQSMERTCREVSDYLLWEEHIVLKQEYLYLDFSLEHLEFVYLPGWKQDIRDSFQELMEGLLMRLDHSDKQAAAMAYEMYQLSLMRENSFFSMIQQAVAAGRRECEEDGGSDCEEAEEAETVSAAVVFPKNENVSVEGGRKLMPRLGFVKIPGFGKSCGLGILKRKEELPYVTQEEEKEAEEHPTELLNIQREIQGNLIYQGEGEQADFKIDKPIFLIGKQKNEVDGYIGKKSVSRVHARIEMDADDYYLEDLNSTNGTRLNGELLEYRQKVKLRCRDRIAFGTEEYIFM